MILLAQFVHPQVGFLSQSSLQRPSPLLQEAPAMNSYLHVHEFTVSQPNTYHIKLHYIFITKNVHHVPWHVVSDDIFPLSLHFFVMLPCIRSRYNFVEIEMVIYSVACGSYWLFIVDCSMRLRINMHVYLVWHSRNLDLFENLLI